MTAPCCSLDITAASLLQNKQSEVRNTARTFLLNIQKRRSCFQFESLSHSEASRSATRSASDLHSAHCTCSRMRETRCLTPKVSSGPGADQRQTHRLHKERLVL